MSLRNILAPAERLIFPRLDFGFFHMGCKCCKSYEFIFVENTSGITRKFSSSTFGDIETICTISSTNVRGGCLRRTDDVMYYHTDSSNFESVDPTTCSSPSTIDSSFFTNLAGAAAWDEGNDRGIWLTGPTAGIHTVYEVNLSNGTENQLYQVDGNDVSFGVGFVAFYGLCLDSTDRHWLLGLGKNASSQDRAGAVRFNLSGVEQEQVVFDWTGVTNTFLPEGDFIDDTDNEIVVHFKSGVGTVKSFDMSDGSEISTADGLPTDQAAVFKRLNSAIA